MNSIKIAIFFYISIFCVGTTSAQNAMSFIYPFDNSNDTFFNQVVLDPMRWMEQPNTTKINEWLGYENLLWINYKKEIGRDIGFIETDLRDYMVFKNNIPTKEGEYYFKIINDNYTSPPSLFFSRNADFSNKIKLFSPIDISTKDKIEISSYEVSPDSKYVAISYSRNGSDIKEIIIVAIKNRKILEDRIYNAAYSSILWVKNGFLYTTYKVKQKFGAVHNPIVYYHYLNTTQENDIEVFKRDNKTFFQYDYKLANDDSTIILREASESRGEFSIFLINIGNNKALIKPAILKMSLKYQFNIIRYCNDSVIAHTTLDNAKGTVVGLNINNPTKWTTIISQFQDALLTNASLIDDTTFFCVYRANAISDLLAKVSHTGDIIKLAFIEQGFTINKITKIDKNNYLIGAGFPILPTIVYNLKLDDFTLSIEEKTAINYDIKNINFSILKYKSDSVEVPLLIIKQKDVKLNGNNPLILEAYGGFGSLTKHGFDPGLIHFLKEGGVYAYAYVRGGGDFGRDWELDGKRLNKKNTIQDFVKAAEYLIEAKYTNANKIAITGTSHGGLLVAAAMIKRPDLFKAVVSKMGVYDMIRWNNFTVGNFHIDEFGSLYNPLDFQNLFSYSPYHNIDTTVNYPSTLLVCGDNDERTTPFQTYKFAAKLQCNPSQKNPVLVKVINKAGHYGAANFDGYIKEIAEEYAFILHVLNEP